MTALIISGGIVAVAVWLLWDGLTAKDPHDDKPHDLTDSEIAAISVAADFPQERPHVRAGTQT